MRRLICLLLVLLFALVWIPTGALAQTSDWQERRTERFAILYASGDDATAEQYAGFVDSIYDEIAAIFGYRTATPVTLRLYPSVDRYYDLNPLARGLSGIVAHADFRRHEVVVIVPQTAFQTEDEVQNNIRHELTHIVAAELSQDQLNTGFQEGIAQYVEHASPELEIKMTLLRDAIANNRMLTWSDLDNRDAMYRNPDISYPQCLSIVAFLVQRSSFTTMRQFLTLSGQSSGYRSALQRAFGASPDTLEREWRNWLPSYLDGGYRRSALSAYDLSHVQQLLQDGRYTQAKSELEDAISWLSTTSQAEVLSQAQQLLERAAKGISAEELAKQARTLLEQTDYAQAASVTAQARQAYADLGDTRQEAVLSAYAERAARGMNATAELDEAQSLAGRLRYPQARAVADHAVAEFTSLGDQGRAQQASALRSMLDQRQTLLGAVLLILGMGGVVASMARRMIVREAEVW